MLKYFHNILLCTIIAHAFSAYASTNYDFTIPYSGAGKLTIVNNSTQALVVKQLQFSNNAAITSTPYGTLWSYQATLSSKPNSDGVNYDYTIAENPAVTIAAGQSAQLSFSFSKHLGPLDLANMATLVTVNNTPVPLLGSCQSCSDPYHGKRVMAYFTDWGIYQRNYHVTDIPTSAINSAIYAFIGFDDKTGNISLLDSNADDTQLPGLQKLRLQYPYLHTSLSFGGWTLSYLFHDLANQATARANFVKQAVAAMKQLGFDGIDIDWEYPVANTAPQEHAPYSTPEDANNYANLLTALRSALNEQGQKDHVQYYLTIAVSAGIDKMNAIAKADPHAWPAIAAAVDYVDIMSYDLHGGFDSSLAPPDNISDFMSAMALDPTKDATAKDPILSSYNVSAAVKNYMALGFKPSQIIMGIPAYGRLEKIVSADQSGLYRTVIATPAGEFDSAGDEASGVFDYKCLVDSSYCWQGSAAALADINWVNETNSPQQFKTSGLGYFSQTPWGFDVKNNLFITYDDEFSLTNKINWLKQQQLAGVMFWELSGDLPIANPHSLLATTLKELPSTRSLGKRIARTEGK